jgi:hypothetical protein
VPVVSNQLGRPAKRASVGSSACRAGGGCAALSRSGWSEIKPISSVCPPTSRRRLLRSPGRRGCAALWRSGWSEITQVVQSTPSARRRAGVASSDRRAGGSCAAAAGEGELGLFVCVRGALRPVRLFAAQVECSPSQTLPPVLIFLPLSSSLEY